MTEQQETKTEHDVDGLLRKNAELLADIKKLKGRIAEIEGERDTAVQEAEAVRGTLHRVQLDEPIEAALADAFRLPWRIVRPLVEEHFSFELGEDGKPVVTAKETGDAVSLGEIMGEMASIPDLASAMRPPTGGGTRGREGGDGMSSTAPAPKGKTVAPGLGLR